MTEPLEQRIAPAGLLTFTDVDGDVVVIQTTKGNNALLDAAVARVPAGGLGGFRIDLINLNTDAAFDGTSITVKATRGADGGDGLVNVDVIQAVNFNLGSVIVDGDLQELNAGKGPDISVIKTITVASTSGSAVWSLNADVGTLRVKTDLAGAEVDITGDLAVLKIGGSLDGNGLVLRGGNVNVDGAIGTATIGCDIQGGGGVDSGFLGAKGIASLTVGGSINGGTANGSGRVSVTGDIGAAAIKGSIVGNAPFSGVVETLDAGNPLSGKVGKITIGGNVIGGGDGSGQLDFFGKATAVKIGGSLVGGNGPAAGTVEANGIGAISVKGSILGGSGSGTATITSSGGIGSVSVGGDLRSFGGTNGTQIAANESAIGTITIGGSIVGTVNETPVLVGNTLGAVTVGGNIVVADMSDMVIIASQKLTSLTVGGRVEGGVIRVFSPGGSIGAVKVGGDWVASSLAVGVDHGGDNFFGNANDTPPGGDPALVAKIASITIGGAVRGTTAAGDHFGFVAERIGAFKVAGTVVPLQTGPANDSSLIDSRLALGLNGDVRIRELG